MAPSSEVRVTRFSPSISRSVGTGKVVLTAFWSAKVITPSSWSLIATRTRCAARVAPRRLTVRLPGSWATRSSADSVKS